MSSKKPKKISRKKSTTSAVTGEVSSKSLKALETKVLEALEKLKLKKNKKSEASEEVIGSENNVLISPRSDYALGLTGIDINDLAIRDINSFKTESDNEATSKIKYDFYNKQRIVLLKELVLTRNKVIKLRLVDENLKKEEEEKHLKSILEKEDIKFQKLLEKQNKESQRLINEQLDVIKKNEAKELKEKQLIAKKQKELEKMQQIMLEKKRKAQQLKEKHENLERLNKLEEEKKFQKAIKMRNENEKLLMEKRRQTSEFKQKILYNRIKKLKERELETIQFNKNLNLSKTQKVEKLTKRYKLELQKYNNNLLKKSQTVKENYKSRKQRHDRQFRRKLEEERKKTELLRQKQLEEEKRLQAFQRKKQQELLLKKKQRQEKIEKALHNANTGEEERLRQIQAAQEKAEKNRQLFIKKKEEEQKLKQLVQHLKNEAAFKQVERNRKAKEFKGYKLMEKGNKEDERRVKDLLLRETLKKHRLDNDNQVKQRQLHIKQQLLFAEKEGDINKMKKIINSIQKQIDNSKYNSNINNSPSKKLPAKQHVIMTPSKLDNNMQFINSIQRSHIKAAMSRTIT